MLKNIQGQDGFLWWYGVVEDRKDPLQIGRYKIRILNHHPESKIEMPTEDLPWACPELPLDHMTNVVGLMEGDWCRGYFVDGPVGQIPVVCAYVPGIPEKEADPTKGFNDPRPASILAGHQVPRDPETLTQHADGSGNDHTEIGLKSRYPDKRFLREAITSRYQRNEFIDLSIVQAKKDNIAVGQTDVPCAKHPSSGVGSDTSSPKSLWTEPETPYNAEYPYNHARLSESGHLIEIDDTPNAERLHRYHRRGTFEEIHTDGSRVTKVVETDHRIVLKDDHTHIEGKQTLTVDKGLKILVNKDGEEQNYDLEVGQNGNLNLTVNKGQLNVFCQDGDANVCIIGNANIKVTEDVNMEVGGDYNLSIMGNKHEVIHGYESKMIRGNKNTTIGGNETKSIVGGLFELVFGSSYLTYCDNLRQDFLKNWKLTVASNKEEKIYGKHVHEVLDTYLLNANDYWIEITNYMSISAKTVKQSILYYIWGLKEWLVNIKHNAEINVGVGEVIPGDPEPPGGDLNLLVTGNRITEVGANQVTVVTEDVNEVCATTTACFHDFH